MNPVLVEVLIPEAGIEPDPAPAALKCQKQ